MLFYHDRYVEQSLLPHNDGSDDLEPIGGSRHAREWRCRGLSPIIPVSVHKRKSGIRRGEGLQFAGRVRALPLQRSKCRYRGRHRCRSHALGIGGRVNF